MVNKKITNDIKSDRTFFIDYKNNVINGMCDGKDSLKQSIMLRLSTIKYDNDIFFTKYGSEINLLMGKSTDEIIVLAPEIITECLLADDRIISVENFDFYIESGFIYISFLVASVYENIKVKHKLRGDEFEFIRLWWYIKAMFR